MQHSIDVPQWARERGSRLKTGEPLDPARTAVVAIDLQNFFIAADQPMGNPYALGILPTVNRLTDQLRRAGATIIYTQNAFDEKNSGRPRSRPLAAGGSLTSALRDGLRPGTHGFALHEDVDVHADDLVLIKTRPSPLHPYAGSGLLEVLEEREITTVVIAGLVNNGCCETTARDAFQYDFRVIFPADATAALTDAEHNASLLNLALYFADVRMTEDVVPDVSVQPA
jgi:ureidoacrylate peracid hydrolase